MKQRGAQFTRFREIMIRYVIVLQFQVPRLSQSGRRGTWNCFPSSRTHGHYPVRQEDS